MSALISDFYSACSRYVEEHESIRNFFRGEIAAHSVEWLGDLIQYSGIIALITATASMIFVMQSKEAENNKVGNWLGTCYIVAETTLVVAIVLVVALKVFMMLRK